MLLERIKKLADKFGMWYFIKNYNENEMDDFLCLFFLNDMTFDVSKYTYVTQDMINEMGGLPSTEFYLLILQKTKQHYIDEFVKELAKILEQHKFSEMEFKEKLVKGYVGQLYKVCLHSDSQGSK